MKNLSACRLVGTIRSRMFQRLSTILAVIVFLSSGFESVSAQVQGQKSASSSVQNRAVLNRSFNLTGQGKEVFELDITSAGKLEARAEWTGTADQVALILNGPGQTQYYARKDGRSPLSLAFAINESHLAKGNSWRLSVAVFGNGTAKGRVQVRLPGASAGSGAAMGSAAKSSAPGLSVSKSKAKEAPAMGASTSRAAAPASKAQAQGPAAQGGGASSTHPATLKILSPNGGEEFISGHPYKILWQTSGDPGPLKLILGASGGNKGMGTSKQGETEGARGIVIARNVPNTGEYDWVATRTGGPPAKFRLQIADAGGKVLDESDGLIALAPYIELTSTDIKVYNKKKKENWLLRTLRAITTAGLSEADTVASGGLAAVKESIDHIKDDKDGGANLKRGADIEVSFAVMQFGTRMIDEPVLSTVTIKQLPSQMTVMVLSQESRFQKKNDMVWYVFKKSFKAEGPLFTPGKYLIEISIDPNHAIPEEPLFRDNNVKTIEFQLVGGDADQKGKIP